MNAAYHHHFLLDDAEIEPIRESGQQDAARVPVDDGVRLRVAFDCRDGDVENMAKRAAEALALSLVPLKCLFDVRFAAGVKTAGFT